MDICIVSDSGAWGPIHTIYHSLSTYSNHKVSVVLKKHDPYGFSKMCESFSLFYHTNKEYTIKAIIKADFLFIIGLPALKSFLPDICKSRFWRKYKIDNPEQYIKSKKIVYFAACSKLLKENAIVNDIYSKWPIDVFFYAIDLKSYVKVKSRKILPYVPPMSLLYYKIPEFKENKEIVLAHSPGEKFDSRNDVKGTKFIRMCFNNLVEKYPGLSYKIIHGVDHEECIKAKGSCDIFVDQIIDESLYNIQPSYLGGQGKSGIEAMALGCLTMTSYRDLNSEPFFKNTPIIKVDKNNLEGTIEKFIINRELRLDMAKKQKEWVDKYLSEEFFASYILKHIG